MKRKNNNHNNKVVIEKRNEKLCMKINEVKTKMKQKDRF